MPFKIPYTAAAVAACFSAMVYAQPQTMEELTADTVPSTAPAGYAGSASAAVPPSMPAYNAGQYAAPPRQPENGTAAPQQAGQGAPQYNVIERRQVEEKLSPEVYQQARQQTIQAAQTQMPVERFWNMSDKEIRQMKRKVENKQAAIFQDVSPNRCTQREIVISGEPNESLPFITLDSRNKTNIMFVDKAGTPYPIQYVMNNAADVSAIFDDNDPEASILYVSSANDYAQGNFTVKLADNPVPVVFVYASNQKTTDCMVTARINSLSKKTQISYQGYNPQTLDTSLNSTLFGVAPPDSRALKTSEPGISAWLQKDGQVVIRTRYTLLSPMPKSRIGSPDGTFVFKVDRSAAYLYKDGTQIKTFTVSYY